MGDRIEACLLQVHNDNFGADTPTSSEPISAVHETAGDNCSPYMELTVRSLAHFHSEFLSRLPTAAPTTSPSSSLAQHHFVSAATFLPGSTAAAPLSPGSGLPPLSAAEPVVGALTQR